VSCPLTSDTFWATPEAMNRGDQRYTFGEGELPAERLRWLADTYAPATRALLERLPWEITPPWRTSGAAPGIRRAWCTESCAPL